MKLSAYLDRINFVGTPKVNEETLKSIHRQHLLQIPYEYFDVSLGNPIDTSVEHAFQKIVAHRRGGWCYEMNGLLAWALTELGFDVTQYAGGVLRSERGDEAIGNHLVLGVQLGKLWLTDVGFGDGLFEPVPLLEGKIEQRGFNFRLEKISDGWRFYNHEYGAAKDFDFSCVPADKDLLSSQCSKLSGHPDSMFVKNTGCQTFTEKGYESLTGRIGKSIHPDGVHRWQIDTKRELVRDVKSRFGLEVSGLESLWPKICARHDALMEVRAQHSSKANSLIKPIQ